MRCAAYTPLILAGVLVAPLVPGVSAQDARTLRPHSAEWERLAAAEDARAATAAQLQIMLNGLASPHTALRAVAVRGVGRLERAELAARIIPLLRDSSREVRVAAAHALGQSLVRGGDAAAARVALHDALANEQDAQAVGAFGETLGRLAADATTAQATVGALTSIMRRTQPDAVLGAQRGMYFLARQQAARSAVAAAAPAIRRIAQSATGDNDTARRTRRLALATLAVTGAHDATLIGAGLADTDPLVRREAAAALGTLADTASARRLVLERALTDTAATVRYEGVRIFARRFAARDGCRPLLDATRDRDAHVMLLAIDLLRTTCPQDPAVTARLDSIARTLPERGTGWHAAAHAFVSLSTRDARSARLLLPRFAAHPSLFVRTYAATAAGNARDTAALVRFARDTHPNVRTAAVEALRRVAGRAADSVFTAQLAHDDNQLLSAAAAAFDSTPNPRVAAAMLDALERISARRSQTMRDSRVALLEAVQKVGNTSLAGRVRRYLDDYDPEVARVAADVLLAWTGTRPDATPESAPALPFPAFADLAQLESATFVFEMDDGASFEVRLLPFAAPTNAMRFTRLARTGYFNGLTFHRVAPNFVVQGGSPAANEYAGDALFTRDELGEPNWRGTVGLSTRGRDTGDAQIYMNTIDNVRLDHDYTVYGTITRGMDIVDRLLEGAVIRRITERRGG